MIKLIINQQVADDEVLRFPYSLQQVDCSVADYWPRLSSVHLYQTEDSIDGYRVLTREVLNVLVDIYDVWLLFSERWSELPRRLRSYVTLLKAEKKALGLEHVVEKEVTVPDSRTVRSSAVRLTRTNLEAVTDLIRFGWLYTGLVKATPSAPLTESDVQRLILLGDYAREHLYPNVPRLAHHLLPRQDMVAIIRLFASQDHEYLSFYLKRENLPALDEMLRSHFKEQLVVPI